MPEKAIPTNVRSQLAAALGKYTYIHTYTYTYKESHDLDIIYGNALSILFPYTIYCGHVIC